MYFRHREDHYGVGSYRHEPIVTPQDAIRPPGGRDAAVADAVHAAGLRGRRGRSEPRAAGARGPHAPIRARRARSTACSRSRPTPVRSWARARPHAACGCARPCGSPTAGAWAVRSPNGWWTVSPPTTWPRPTRTASIPFQMSPPYVVERGKQQYREVYDIIHPLQQMARPRKIKLAPWHERQRALGAGVLLGGGLGAAAVVRRQRGAGARRCTVGDAGIAWAARSSGRRRWVPSTSRPVSCVGLFDITAFAKFDVHGPGRAGKFLERICANRIDRPVGSIVYTAMLTPRGGIRCDLTVIRKDEELFRVVTGGGSGQHDLAWLRAQIDDDASVAITERTGSLFALGLWGPRARDVLQSRDGRRPVERSVPVHDRALPPSGRGQPRMGPAHLVRGRAGIRAVRPDRDGRPGLGPAVGGRSGARHHRRRGRRVRLAAAGEGLPAVGPGHRHRARSAGSGARLRGEVGQGLPGPGRAGTDPGRRWSGAPAQRA